MSKEIYNSRFYNDANLVAYYRLENVNDSKGANNLTNTGTVAFNAAKFNNGADFGSSNTTKQLKVASGFGINYLGNMSLSIWWKLPSDISSGAMIPCIHSTNVGSTRSLTIQYEYNSGTRRLNFASSGTDNFYTKTLGTEWHNLVIVRNNTLGIIRGYIDGQPVLSGTIGAGTSGNQYFVIGSGDEYNYSNGLVDDVAVFSRALSDNEIYELYHDLSFKYRPGSLGSML